MQVEKFSTWLCGYDSSCIWLIILVCNSARILINPFNQQTWMNFSMFIKQKELLSLWRMICRFWFHMRTWSGIGRTRKPSGPPLRLVSSHSHTHLRLIPLSPLLGLLVNVLRSFVHWFCVSETKCCRIDRASWSGLC